MPSDHYINRELSWLAFNERVLEEAARESLPLLERLKFLAITASNLDEFFMVRVGGLRIMKERGQRSRDPSGLTPTKQLELIRTRVQSFIEKQYELLDGQLLPGLREHGIRRLTPAELTPAQRTFLEEHFREQIYPVLSPVAIDPDGPRVQVPALQLVLICEVRSGAASAECRRVLVTLPPGLPRHVVLPDSEAAGQIYLNLEDVVEMFLGQFFPQEHVTDTACFRISRNGDIAVDDESALDLATEMEHVLEARNSSATIRLEIERGASREQTRAIQSLCGTDAQHTYVTPGELDLRSFFALASAPGFENLKVEPWPIGGTPDIEPNQSIFDAVRAGDILLHHPYESFEPILRLVEEAAADPNVVAIKQILYRTAKNSRIISALIKAAQDGKHVTVLVELKARFDEARNLDRAEDLINAGAQIIYGVRGLKTHAKICMVMRRESGRLVRYCHFGTGNYNEATAKLYTDISYLTRREDFGTDASSFFNTVTGRSRFVHFHKISMAPFGLRERLMEMIQSETERAKQGDTAEMMLKMNSLEDPQMIEALYAASAAGVSIQLNIRGICCLRPGLPGVSENIRVISVIDRNLEHARIFWFRQGGSPVVFISSADFMKRNLSKRVELLTPIEDAEARARLQSILETQFADNTRARELKADGTYVQLSPAAEKPLRSQEFFARKAARQTRSKSEAPDVLVPHRPTK